MNQQMMMRIKKMQKEMMEQQERIQNTVYTGKAGGGMVVVEITGAHEVKKVTIDPEALEGPEDIEMIEDSLVAALNDALRKIDEDNQKVVGGMPGMGGFF